MRLYPKSSPLFLRLLFMTALLLVIHEGWSQNLERVYATKQENGGTFLTSFHTSPENAVDQNPSTFSTIGITVVGNVWQKLYFPTSLPSGTTVKIKIGSSNSLLGALSNISIQPYLNTQNAGPPILFSELLSLVDGEDQGEIILTPSSSFNSIRIESKGISLGSGLKIYEAYYHKETTTTLNCDRAIDVLYGSSGKIADGLNTIDNPFNAIDFDINTYATLRANVSLTSNITHITALYDNPSYAEDSVYIVLKNPIGLLDVGLLSSSLTIKTYLDDHDNGSIFSNESLLSLRLLPGSSDVQILTFPISQPFNRIQISLGGGLLNALSSLEIHDIKRIIPKPEIVPSYLNNEICEGNNITLFIENPCDYYDYYWYNNQIDGQLLHQGNAYTPPPLLPNQEYFYYVTASRKGCIEESDRTKTSITVHRKPGSPQLTISNNEN